MTLKSIIVVLTVLLVAGALVLSSVDQAYAAGDGLSSNMEKKGLDALASKKFKTCTWPQAMVGLGSLVVAWAVVKWV